MDEIENLRKLLKDEQRRREAAEALAKESQAQTLSQYLDSNHSLNLGLRVVTDRSLTTKGDVTDPIGRLFPRRIVPWGDGFVAGQQRIWKKLLNDPSFSSSAAFPSLHQLEYVASKIRPLASEIDLRLYEHETVETAVEKLVRQAYKSLTLRKSLNLSGPVNFKSHTNLGDNSSVTSGLSVGLTVSGGEDKPAPNPAVLGAFRQARIGKVGPADQFCICETSGGQNFPVLAIEYKAPHKLTREEVVTGLQSEIRPKRDVINQEGEGFVFASKSLTAAIITQLFSYMVSRGIRLGYVCTGETFIFLRIPDDPTIVYYYLCVPNLDVGDDDKNRLQRTAVAQVFAFTLRALQETPPRPGWFDRVIEGLETWPVEYDDVLSRIPKTVRKEPKEPSPYKPPVWKELPGPPMQTRSRGCRPQTHQDQNSSDHSSGGSSSEDLPPPSPSPLQPHNSRTRRNNRDSTAAAGSVQEQHGKGTVPARTRIEDRPYCTHECLAGLASKGPLDRNCPNVTDHGQQHLDPLTFLSLIRSQLAQDRGPDADAMPLYQSGAIGSLFKVRLSARGYTLVAKGVERYRLGRLRHECEIYDRLRPIQGQHVPVCLGIVDLVLPYYYDAGVFEHFLFLSWAGRPLSSVVKPTINRVEQSLLGILEELEDQPSLINAVTTAFNAIHALGILHCDAELRNILYDKRPIIVDFERAAVNNRQSLSITSLNRKRKHGMLEHKERDDYTKEIESITRSIRRCLST